MPPRARPCRTRAARPAPARRGGGPAGAGLARVRVGRAGRRTSRRDPWRSGASGAERRAGGGGQLLRPRPGAAWRGSGAAPGREALAKLAAGEERLRTATAVLGSLFALDRIDEAIEVANEQIRDGLAPAALRAQRAVLLVFAGRTAEAADEARAALVPQAARCLRRADELTTDGPQLFHGELGVGRVVLDWLGGRWDSALERMRTLAAELEVQQVTQASALTAVELEIRTWRGELVLAAPLAARPAPAARNVASLHAWALAGFLAARGDPDAARRTLLTAADDPAVATYAGLLLSRLAELELEQGRADDAAKTLARLADLTESHVSPWARTTLHRTAGTVTGDAGALSQAVGEAELGGLVFERARALLGLGELPGAGDDGLVEAYQTFARLGAHGLRRRAGRRLHDLGAKVPRVRSRAGGLLTESEEKVARLVQQGMRNREIAAALHYSPRSIEVYLSRIYAKLRVDSRLELARALDAMDAHP